MFEVIGIISVWLFCAWLCMALPLFLLGNGDGLSSLAIGLFWGKVSVAAYLLATVVYAAIKLRGL